MIAEPTASRQPLPSSPSTTLWFATSATAGWPSCGAGGTSIATESGHDPEDRPSSTTIGAPDSGAARAVIAHADSARLPRVPLGREPDLAQPLGEVRAGGQARKLRGAAGAGDAARQR
jgi:hypothetical protein